MNNPRIIFDNQGVLAVKIPYWRYVEELMDKTGLNMIQVLIHIANRELPAGTKFRIVDASELPADRTFRDAWVFEPSENDLSSTGAPL
jgi:hypothetical protein